MARITVEDCVTVVPNRFKLCIIASNRARSIMSGADTQFSDKEKPAVISLREIADGHVDINAIESSIIKNIKEHNGLDYSVSNETHEQVETAFADESESIPNQQPSANFVSENIEVED